MIARGSLFSKDTSLFTISLGDIKSISKDKLRSDFKNFLKENINESTIKSKNIDKLVDKKLNLAENPLYQLTKDVFLKTSASKNDDVVTTDSVLKKFKLNATKFLEEATPEEIKILQEYYSKNIAEGNFLDRWLGSSNKCTDSKDDGKISFGAKVANIVEGVGKTVVGCAKEILTNDKKLLKLFVGSGVMMLLSTTTIGAIAIPILGLFTAGNLILKGGKKIINNVKLAEQATTDAEAKDRWENVGNGLTQTGVGVVVGYTSGKATANILKNGPQNIIVNGKEMAKSKHTELKNKDAVQIAEEIEMDIIKDPTNFVED